MHEATSGLQGHMRKRHRAPHSRWDAAAGYMRSWLPASLASDVAVMEAGLRCQPTARDESKLQA